MPDHQAELLGQHHAGPDVNPRIKIVEMNAHENAGQDQEDPHQAAVIEQKDRGIDFENQVSG